MLSREENELITRVGQGTPMGNTMRRYWIPALLAREIAEPDGPPVRVRLLGEDLVAFRDSRGRIGLLDEYCRHGRACVSDFRRQEKSPRQRTSQHSSRGSRHRTSLVWLVRF